MTHFQCTRHFRPGKVVTQELPYPVLGKRCSPGLSPRRRNKTTFLQDPSFSTCLTPTRLTVSFTADKTAVLSLNFNSPDQPRPTQNVEANAFRTAKSKRPAPGGCPATGLASGGAGSHRPLAPPGGARALPASAPLPGATAQGRGAQGAGGGAAAGRRRRDSPAGRCSRCEPWVLLSEGLAGGTPGRAARCLPSALIRSANRASWQNYPKYSSIDQWFCSSLKCHSFILQTTALNSNCSNVIRVGDDDDNNNTNNNN